MSRRAPALCLTLLLCSACGVAAKKAPESPAPASGEADDAGETPTGSDASPASLPYQEQRSAEEGGKPAFATPPLDTLDDAEKALERESSSLANALASARDCNIARRALGSMERASERICDLNGPDDPGRRCEQARDRLEAAREKVRRACGD